MQKPRTSEFYKQLGKAGTEKGKSSEKRVLEILLEDLPDWCFSVRRSSHREDQLGFDLLLVTDVGEIPVQVKSSRTGANNFMSKKNKSFLTNVVVVVYNSDKQPNKIREQVFHRALAIRRQRTILW